MRIRLSAAPILLPRKEKPSSSGGYRTVLETVWDVLVISQGMPNVFAPRPIGVVDS